MTCKFHRILFATTALASVCVFIAQPASAQPTNPANVDESLTVTGANTPGNSVLSPSTRRHSTTAVVVVGGDELRATGQQTVMGALAQLSPSISSPPSAGGGTNAFIRTMQLRGLSPDDTLILVNGQRRHITALFNPNLGPNLGSEPADIALIPISAVDHICPSSGHLAQTGA